VFDCRNQARVDHLEADPGHLGDRLWIYDVRWVLRRARRAAEQTFTTVRREPAPTTR
jgi:hypothetical protein